MCGVTGFWDTSKRTSSDMMQAALHKMSDTIVHRGPDGAGIWLDANIGIGLAHRRLAIIDLSEHGKQPMCSASQRYVISYNGEIYNHLEIKQLLQAENNVPDWRGHSDTEIILAAFEAWGVEVALTKFVGMFAISLWDTQEKRLFLIRDRMGEKPLYYGWCGDHLIFGSELKSLHAHFAWSKNINRDSVSLLMQYNCIPAPYTIYENIFKLEPGNFAIINSDKSMHKVAYWQLKNVINEAKPIAYSSPGAAVDALEKQLKLAIQQQMSADVPVGAFLSGGIDSSTIVALMQQQSIRPIKTFTIGFDDHAYNEAEQAKAIAKHLQTEHTELYLSPEQTTAIISDLPNFYDEPFADSSQIPTYIVAKLTRQHVTVSLSGDGGDELFAGYNRYTWLNMLWKKLSYLPKPARKLLAKIIMFWPPRSWDKLFIFLNTFLPNSMQQRNPGEKLYKLAALCDAESPYAIYNMLLTHWSADTKVLLPDLSKDLNSASLTTTMMYSDSMRYLPDDILVKVDRAAMAVSLETRMPFLDHRVIEFAWSLPIDLKIRNGKNKWILREVLNRHVPPALFERPKMGFGIPIDQLLRGPLKEWAQDLLTSSMLSKHNLLDSKLIQKRWSEHLSGAGNWQYHLWDVLVFQSWYEAHHG